MLPATAPLGTAAGEWGCTYDNTTGLMWEVKTADSGLRDRFNAYSWYNPNAATNGGTVGVENGGGCNTAGRCDTLKFVQDVNATNMCGRGDWRLPTVRELLASVKLAGSPTIDAGYFPNTATTIPSQSSNIFVRYWTSTPAPPTYIWTIDFGSGRHSLGSADYVDNQGRKGIRLVRTGL